MNTPAIPSALIAFNAIPDGGFAEVEAVVDGNDAESLLLHRDGDRVRAWLNICPHAGRRLDWAPGQFLKTKEGLLVCAAHGASFELDGGTSFDATLCLQHVGSMPQGSGGGQRLGCSFVDLDAPAQRALQRFIDHTQQRRRLLSRR